MPRYDHGRLRAAREAAGLTQQAVADLICKTSSTYARYEQGTIVPTVPVLGAIAGALDVPVSDLFDPDDPNDAVAAFSAEIKALVDKMPPFTTEQKSQLRALLRGVA